MWRSRVRSIAYSALDSSSRTTTLVLLACGALWVVSGSGLVGLFVSTAYAQEASGDSDPAAVEAAGEATGEVSQGPASGLDSPLASGSTIPESEAGFNPNSAPPPAPDSTPRATRLAAPRAPNAYDQARLTRRLEEASYRLSRQRTLVDDASFNVTLLYVGGISLTVGSVALWLMALVKGICPFDDAGACVDAQEYVVAAIPATLTSVLMMFGAALDERRVSQARESLRREEAALRELEDVSFSWGVGRVGIRASF